MADNQEDRIHAELAGNRRKTRNFKVGLVFFAIAYIAAAITFIYIYYQNRKTESLVMAIIMVVLTAASIHGYRQRILQLYAEKLDIEEKLRSTENKIS